MRGLLVGFVFALLACQSPAPTPGRTLRVSVTDDDGHALSGISIEIDGVSATKTNAEGTARISLSPSGPARARIAVLCTPESLELPPRHVPRAVSGGTARLELAFVCRPRQRTLAIVVRAPGGQGLWLRADGEPVGRIEPDGTLHATVSREPEQELRLSIDTGDLPLSPRHPQRVVRVLDRDELVIFDQPLITREPRPRTKSVALTRREAPPTLPYAIRGNGT